MSIMASSWVCSLLLQYSTVAEMCLFHKYFLLILNIFRDRYYTLSFLDFAFLLIYTAFHISFLLRGFRFSCCCSKFLNDLKRP